MNKLQKFSSYAISVIYWLLPLAEVLLWFFLNNLSVPIYHLLDEEIQMDYAESRKIMVLWPILVPFILLLLYSFQAILYRLLRYPRQLVGLGTSLIALFLAQKLIGWSTMEDTVVNNFYMQLGIHTHVPYILVLTFLLLVKYNQLKDEIVPLTAQQKWSLCLLSLPVAQILYKGVLDILVWGGRNFFADGAARFSGFGYNVSLFEFPMACLLVVLTLLLVRLADGKHISCTLRNTLLLVFFALSTVSAFFLQLIFIPFRESMHTILVILLVLLYVLPFFLAYGYLCRTRMR